MTENEHSRVKEGLNTLSNLKNKKSILKKPTEEKENEKKNIQLLSDADLHVRNLLSDFLVNIGHDEKENIDIKNKIEFINQQKNKKPKIKFLETSDDASSDDNVHWGKSKTKMSKGKPRFSKLMNGTKTSSSNSGEPFEKKFLTMKKKTTKSLSINGKPITKRNSLNGSGNALSQNYDKPIMFSHASSGIIKSKSSTQFLREESGDENDDEEETLRVNSYAKEEKHAFQRRQSSRGTIKKVKFPKLSSKRDSSTQKRIEKKLIKKLGKLSFDSEDHKAVLTKDNADNADYEDEHHNYSDTSLLGAKSERMKHTQSIIIDDQFNDDETDIRNIIPMNRQNFREFSNICSKIQESVMLQPKDKKISNSTKFLPKKNNLSHIFKKRFSEEDTNLPHKKLKANSSKQANNNNESVINLIKLEGEGEEESETERDKKLDELKYRVLTRKTQLVYDSISDEEDTDEEISEALYLEPSSLLLIIYDGILFCLTLYSFFYIPLHIAFSLRKEVKINPFFIFNAFIDGFYIFDIFLSFFTAYYNFEEQLITEISEITLNYLSTWFLLDLISGAPIFCFLELSRYKNENSDYSKGTLEIFTSNSSSLLNLLKLLKLVKVFKVFFSNAFVGKVYHYLKENDIAGWIRLQMTLLIFVFSVHLFTCIFIFLGYNYHPTWIIDRNIDPDYQGDIYICSLYFVFQTVFSVGYGDVKSHKIEERVFQVILLVVGLGIYTWCISSLSAYYNDNDQKIVEYKQNCLLLEEIRLTYDNMPKPLYEKLQRFLLYRLNNDKIDCNIIYEDLPIGLRNNLIYEMYKPIIQNFVFFKNFNSTDFIIKVILCFKPLYAMKNEKLVNDGDVMEEIIFVKNGKLVLEFPLPIVLSPEVAQSITKNFSMGLTKTFSSSNPMAGTSLQDKIAKTLLGNKSKNFDLEDFEWNKKPTKKVEKVPQPQIHQQYFKLIEIRRNEHFGDILMFLNKRSPLSVKVKSKFAELFLLKKTDAVEISMSFPKIWRQIIKKSLFNMQQINRLINKSLKIFFMHYEGQNKTFEGYSKTDTFSRGLTSKNTYVRPLSTIKEIMNTQDDELHSIPSNELKKISERVSEEKSLSNKEAGTNKDSGSKNNTLVISKIYKDEFEINNSSLINSDNSLNSKSSYSNDTVKQNVNTIEFPNADVKKEEKDQNKNKESSCCENNDLGDTNLIDDDSNDSGFNNNNSSGWMLKKNEHEINTEYYSNEGELKQNILYTRPNTKNSSSIYQFQSKENDPSAFIQPFFNKRNINEGGFTLAGDDFLNSNSDQRLLDKSSRKGPKKNFLFNFGIGGKKNSASGAKKESSSEITKNSLGNKRSSKKKPTPKRFQRLSTNREEIFSLASSYSPERQKKSSVSTTNMITVIKPKLQKTRTLNPDEVPHKATLRKSVSITPNLRPCKKSVILSQINPFGALNLKQKRKDSETTIGRSLTPVLHSQTRNTRRKAILLDEISTNIAKNSENLKNPGTFYSSMFAKVINQERETKGANNLNKKLDGILKLVGGE